MSRCGVYIGLFEDVSGRQLFMCVNPNKRVATSHVEYETDAWFRHLVPIKSHQSLQRGISEGVCGRIGVRHYDGTRQNFFSSLLAMYLLSASSRFGSIYELYLSFFLDF